MPRRPSTGWASRMKRASSRRTARRTRLVAYAEARARARPQSHHRRRRRRRASARHGGGDDAAAGARRADRVRSAQRRSTACSRSSRCRAACRSARWPSASRARSTPPCSPPASWRSSDERVAARARRAGARSRPTASPSARRIRPSTHGRLMLAPGSNDRHSRRRPARPHDRARRGARSAIAAMSYCPKGQPGEAGDAARRPRADYDDEAALGALCRLRSMSSPSSSRTCRPRPPNSSPSASRCSPARRRCASTQDRLREKDFLRSIGVGTTRLSRSDEPCRAAPRRARRSGRTAILKTVRLGYDGKGQVSIGPDSDLAAAWREHRRRRSASSKASSISPARFRSSSRAARPGATRDLCAGREPARQPHPRHDDRAGAHQAGDRDARRGDRASRRRQARPGRAARGRDVRHAAAARCWSTSWRRGRTIPAIGRSMPATPANSSSSCARSAACRSARPSVIPMR